METKHNMDCLIKFRSEIASIALPERFTFPFNYTPHPLASIAAEELQEIVLKHMNWQHDFGFDENPDSRTAGKMFGVLVVKTLDDEIAYLAAFSGKIGDSQEYRPFVPPLYNRLEISGFFNDGEAELNRINAKIDALELHHEWLRLNEELQKMKADSELLLAATRKEIKGARNKRDEQRKNAISVLTEIEFNALQLSLAKESQDYERNYKRLLKSEKARIELLDSEINHLRKEIDSLKQRRKDLSASLQNRLFQQYQFLNRGGIKKSLIDIFDETVLKVPPAGAGDCAAPKLMQYAFENNLQPLCMAEFWWGESPVLEVRKHGGFYPACRGKCEPILGHMLQGMELDENPIQVQLASKKELEILFDDEYLAVVLKPVDLLSVPGKSEQDSVYLRIKRKYPEAQGPLIVHRLDMSTSGLMIVAKNDDVYKDLQKQFLKRSIKKRYVALLNGIVENDRGVIDLPLRVDLDNRPSQMVCYEHGKSARTEYAVLNRNVGVTRVNFYPVTGRTHQLRVHAAHADGLNVAIVGDDIYGKKADRLYLHAEYIAFRHPILQIEIELESIAEF